MQTIGFKASETLLGIETLLFNLEELKLGCFKASETLLGIETYAVLLLATSSMLQSLWNPFRDWNGVVGGNLINKVSGGFKASETLLGIETSKIHLLHIVALGFKASETLLGIETLL